MLSELGRQTPADISLCRKCQYHPKSSYGRLDSTNTVHFALGTKSVPPKLWEIYSFRPVITLVLVVVL